MGARLVGSAAVTAVVVGACGGSGTQALDAMVSFDSPIGVVDAAIDSAADAGPSGPELCEDCYYSELVPFAWEPGYSPDGEHFVHDFSYAGYRYGERDFVAPNQAVANVDDFGADPSGTRDSTEAVQAAIDSLAAGGEVRFSAGDYRFDGRLFIDADGVVLAGAGPSSRLRFHQYADMNNRAHITFGGNAQRGDEVSLVEDGAIWDTTVRLVDASGFSAGDDIALGWVITNAFVDEHNMAGTWEVFNGDWQVFFWRTVVAVDTSTTPHTLTFDIPLRYPAKVRDQASVVSIDHAISECGIRDLAISNASSMDQAWDSNQVDAVLIRGAKDCRIDRVRSYQPAGTSGHVISGGIRIDGSKRVTIADTHLGRALHRGSGGNGYLFQVRQSGEVLTRDSTASAGRHNFIQNWGFGTTGSVWLRCESRDGRALFAQWDPIGQVGFSEFHHSLALANLIDGGIWDDGFAAENRRDYSSGAGHSATQNVFWNLAGAGRIQSKQFGLGYVIGASDSLTVDISTAGSDGAGTAPQDYVEAVPTEMPLAPTSLYEWQRAKRLAD